MEELESTLGGGEEGAVGGTQEGQGSQEGAGAGTGEQTGGTGEGSQEGAGGAGAEGGEGSKGEGEGEGEGQSAGAPEAYEDFTLPDGFEAVPERMDAFKALCKEFGLPQEGAQKALDFYLSQEQAGAEMRQQAFDALQKGWRETLAKDPDFGGEKLAENTEAVRRAVARIEHEIGDVNGELRRFLRETGAGNHPELVKAFYWVANQISEDNPPQPAGGGGGTTPTEKLMYPTMEKSS